MCYNLELHFTIKNHCKLQSPRQMLQLPNLNGGSAVSEFFKRTYFEEKTRTSCDLFSLISILTY